MVADRALGVEAASGLRQILKLGTGVFVSGTELQGRLQLVERKQISANASTVTFSGLNGESDGSYILLWRMKNNGSAEALYEFRPNGATTNGGSNRIRFSTSTSSTSHSTAVFARCDPSQTSMGFASFLPARVIEGVSLPRYFISRELQRLSSATSFGTTYSGIWDETATDITSLEVNAGVTNGIGAGSTLALYRLKGGLVIP